MRRMPERLLTVGRLRKDGLRRVGIGSVSRLLDGKVGREVGESNLAGGLVVGSRVRQTVHDTEVLSVLVSRKLVDWSKMTLLEVQTLP